MNKTSVLIGKILITVFVIYTLWYIGYCFELAWGMVG